MYKASLPRKKDSAANREGIVPWAGLQQGKVFRGEQVRKKGRLSNGQTEQDKWV